MIATAPPSERNSKTGPSLAVSLRSRPFLRNADFILSTRLVGLAALVGVVNSEALYHSMTYFQPQVSVIMRALLVPFLQVDVPVLDHE